MNLGPSLTKVKALTDEHLVLSLFICGKNLDVRKVENVKLTQAMSLQVVLPAAFDQSLSQVFLESGLLARLIKLLLDQTLLEDDV